MRTKSLIMIKDLIQDSEPKIGTNKELWKLKRERILFIIDYEIDNNKSVADYHRDKRRVK